MWFLVDFPTFMDRNRSRNEHDKIRCELKNDPIAGEICSMGLIVEEIDC